MIKTLAGQVKEFKKDSIITPIFMILEVIMEMIIPLLMSSIIDDGVEKGDIHHIYIIGIWMVVAAGIGLFAGIMGGKYGARASTGFARNLRQAMFENIQTFSFSNIDKFSTPSLVTRMTTDVTNLQNSYQMLLRMCVRAPFSLICAMIMSFSVNVKLASIYLVAVIIGVFQGFAVLPGISRAGVTIVACLLCGLNRKFAIRYSFLLSIPAVIGAVVLEIVKLNPSEFSARMAGMSVLGFIAAAVTGCFCIKMMLKIVKRKPFRRFSVYCFFMAVLAIICSFAL